MTRNHFLKETFFDRAKIKIKSIFRFFPVWKDLLFLALCIISYQVITIIIQAIPPHRTIEYTSKDLVKTEWSAASGDVDHYQLEIRDTRFFPGSRDRSSGITMVKQATSTEPSYQLKCEHNHSYEFQVAAVSPAGIFSPFSRRSNLLICDQQPPRIELESLPSPAKLRFPSISIRGTFVEPNLESIIVNLDAASIDSSKQTFVARTNLSPGRNHLTLLAKDLAGNTTTRTIELDYAPVSIVSLPTGAKIYWNGNHAYLGIYSGNTPQAFNQAVQGKQVLRLTYPGFNDYYGVIDFSALTKDTYAISLTPFSGVEFAQVKQIVCNDTAIAIGQCSYPFAVDDDLDGNKDLLVGTREGTIALFTNTGTDDNPEFKDYYLLKAGEEPIDAGTHAAPFVVDYNNDGAKDLLVGTGEGYLTFFANRGSSSRPVYGPPVVLKDAQGAEITVGSYCTPQVVDWNGDNKKDLLLGSGEGTLSVYLNQGTDSNPLFSSARPVEADGALLDVGSFAAPFMADWNGDGKQDMLVGDGEGYIHLYLDISTGAEPQLIASGKVKISEEELTVDGSAVPFLVDWDNDGKKELLVGSQQGDIHLVSH